MEFNETGLLPAATKKEIGCVQDTVFLWSNLSCIRSGGHGFEPRRQPFDEHAD